MNTLENKIQEDLKSSMKLRNTERTECLKMVKTAFMELKTAVNGKHLLNKKLFIYIKKYPKISKLFKNK